MLQVIWRIPITYWSPDGVPIYGFGMMLFLAFILCTWLAGKRGEREGIPKATIQDLAIWVFIGGLLGARITSILGEGPVPTFQDCIDSVKEVIWAAPDGYRKVPRLFRIWDGGIVLYGSILGGLAGYCLAYLLVFRKTGLSTRRLCDAIAPSIALGLALGRVGCFFNGCCYGQAACAECPVYPVSFPLCAPPREELVRPGYQTAAGFTVVPQFESVRGAEVGLVNPDSPAYKAGLRSGATIVGINGHPVRNPRDLDLLLSSEHWLRGETHLKLEYQPRPGGEVANMDIVPRTLGLYPTQLYEVVSMLLLCLVLFAYEPFRRNPGQVMAVLMMGYGVHRYLNEILRGDPRPKDFETYGSFLCFGLGLALWVWLWRKAVDPPVTPVGDAAAPRARPIPA